MSTLDNFDDSLFQDNDFAELDCFSINLTFVTKEELTDNDLEFLEKKFQIQSKKRFSLTQIHEDDDWESIRFPIRIATKIYALRIWFYGKAYILNPSKSYLKKRLYRLLLNGKYSPEEAYCDLTNLFPPIAPDLYFFSGLPAEKDFIESVASLFIFNPRLVNRSDKPYLFAYRIKKTKWDKALDKQLETNGNVISFDLSFSPKAINAADAMLEINERTEQNVGYYQIPVISYVNTQKNIYLKSYDSTLLNPVKFYAFID